MTAAIPMIRWPHAARMVVPARQLVGLACALAAWEIVFRAGVVPERYFSGPVQVATTLFDLLGQESFWLNEAATVLRSLLGLFVGTGLGLLLAVLAGYAPVVGRALAPVVELMRSLPPAALVPLSIFALGLGANLFAFIVGFAVICTVYLSAANGLASSDRVLMDSGRAIGLSKRDLLWHVRLPAAAPEILTGIRIASAQAMMATIAAEMLAGQNGVGFMLMDSAFTMQTHVSFALIVVAGLNGAVLSGCVTAIGNHALDWHRGLAAQQETR